MLLWSILKDEHNVKGDRGRPAKNPPMVKSVFSEFQVVWTK